MQRENDRQSRNGLELPSNLEYRDFELEGDSFIVSMIDTPYCPPFAVDTSHYHNCLELGLCLSGSGVFGIESKEWRFSAGSFHVVPKGVRHHQTNEGTPITQWRYLEINDERLLRETPTRCREAIQRWLRKDCARGRFYDHCGENVESIFQTMFDLQRRYAAEATAELEACALLLLTRLAREPDNEVLELGTERRLVQPIEPALLYLSEHYENEIHIGELAKACAMSESHFRRQFLRLMDMPPLEYVNRYRVHRSIFLLRATNESIANVAARIGFPSVATYHRNFLRYVGQSPMEWRKVHANR